MSFSTSSIDQSDRYNETENMFEINLFNDSSSFISCNFTRLYDVSDVQKTSIGLVITYCVSLFLVLFIGCPLYLAIVHYEHFGEDSQKRSLANMTFTNICIFVILLLMILYFGIGLRITFGPLYHWLASLLLGTKALFVFCIILTLLFSMVLKNLLLLKPSLSTSFNDKSLYIVVSFGTLAFGTFPAYRVWFNDENEFPLISFYNGNLSGLFQIKPHTNPSNIQKIPDFFLKFMASSFFFNILIHFVIKIIKMPKTQPIQSPAKTTQIAMSYNNISRNSVVVESIVVLIVFALNIIGDFVTIRWVRHLASKPETFHLLPMPWLLQTLVLGVLDPLFFFTSNKKLKEYAGNEFFKVNISREETKVIPVIKVTDSNQDFGQSDFDSMKTEEFSEDIHQEYYKTIITHMDCMDCLAMPSSSSQTVILCIKHQEDEKSEPYIDRKITLEACIREQELDTDSDGEF